MKGKPIVVATAVVGAGIAVLPLGSATTAPGLTVKIRVVMSESGVTLSQVKSYRGWSAHFIVVNQGKKPHRFEIGGLETPVVQPGTKKVLKVELALRGKVTYKDLLN